MLEITSLVSPGSPHIPTIAERMADTLLEVLGERGADMYTPAWLEGRVRWHIEHGQVLLALEGDTLLGYTQLRMEEEVGLYATTWVHPLARRRGTASALLDAGEDWLSAQGAGVLATNTDQDNTPLIRLFQARGFQTVLRVPDKRMVRLERPLSP